VVVVSVYNSRSFATKPPLFQNSIKFIEVILLSSSKFWSYLLIGDFNLYWSSFSCHSIHRCETSSFSSNALFSIDIFLSFGEGFLPMGFCLFSTCECLFCTLVPNKVALLGPDAFLCLLPTFHLRDGVSVLVSVIFQFFNKANYC
jgi:hypothetical protein